MFADLVLSVDGTDLNGTSSLPNFISFPLFNDWNSHFCFAVPESVSGILLVTVYSFTKKLLFDNLELQTRKNVDFILFSYSRCT